MINAQKAKYIKLGEAGRLENICFKTGTLRLGYHQVPDELGDNFDAVKNIFYDKFRKTKSTSSDHARQVTDFYNSGLETIWFTFSNGLLYWCQAEKDVTILGYDAKKDGKDGSRYKKTISGWSNKDIEGNDLLISKLSGKLTKVAGYRGTICNIDNELFNYLKRKINCQDLEQISKAKIAKDNTLKSIEELFKFLHWKDFELLVELVFAKSGWQRISSLGGTQKTIDIEILLPSTEESAFVQVKSHTKAGELESYIKQHQERVRVKQKNEKMFYVFHSPKDIKMEINDDNIKLINSEKLAKMVLDAGLFNWLLEKVG